MRQSELLRKIYWTSTFLAIFILILLASAIFLNPTSVGSPHFIWNINLWAVIWALNFTIILVLTFILARTLIKLYFEYQADQPGSRIKRKLVTTLIIFSLFPTLIMSFLFFGLINRNLTQWFSSPSRQLTEDSQAIAARYYQEKRAAMIAAAYDLAQGDSQPFSSGLEGWASFDPGGQTIHHSGNWNPSQSFQDTVAKVLSGKIHYEVNRLIDANPLDIGIRLHSAEQVLIDFGMVGVPIPGPDGHPQGAAFGFFTIPQSVSFHAARVEEAAEKYEALKSGASQIYINYYWILALTTLAVIFGFVWLGTYIARKITVPLEALAEGSRELASGNLDYRVDVKAVEELGVLVNSFNRMADEIKQSRQDLERANQELRTTNVRLDERRRYIETVLQNIATGVITVSENNIIQTVNEAACKMLQADRKEVLNRSIQEVAGRELYADYERMKERARLYGTHRKELTLRRGDGQLHIAATITSNPLPMKSEAEYLVVLDDLTELIRAEKFAAWQEVARRLAHEIKNPLTPIQLSAERVQKRFERIAAATVPDSELKEFGKVLGDATRIIVAEAEILKSLVQEFSRFARLPICKPVEIRLHDLIEETLALYDGGLDNIRVEKYFDPEINGVKLDPEQIRRVFLNLIDNSLDALAGSSPEKLIEIRTRFNPARESITVELHDNGVGIAPEDYERLFLPYFSTKKKGTGLGLAIVRQIVSEHNGFIRAEPNLPRGTRFIMELPAG
ncbi:MAG: sensor histidine kinase [Acidobacteriota bacterium]